MHDPTKRFSNRVENYLKYRPGYPVELYDYLHTEAGLRQADQIADLGSGTGLLSKLFLDRGHQVFAVEPNAEMRSAAETLFNDQPNFVSLDGRAEAIPLADGSVDFVTAGQAFHWFEPEATRNETERVLHPGGQVALIWNTRQAKASPFQAAYEELLLNYGTDFKQVDHHRNFPEEKIAGFFAPNKMRRATFPHEQSFDLEGLQGRLLSSSYAPTPDEPNYQPMLNALKEIFDQFKEQGSVHFLLVSEVYHAALD